MPFREKRIESGDIFEVEVYPITSQEYKKPRSVKSKESRKEQKRLNNKNSIKMFKRKIYANFDNNSFFTTLTYKNNIKPKKEDAVIKDVKNFLARVRYRIRKKGGGELKYIYVIESGENDNNFHVHMILDADIGLLEIEKIWGKGTAPTSRLDASPEGVEGLARYMSKEPKGSKRWKSSLNLIMSKVCINDSKYRSKKSIDRLVHSIYDRAEIEKLYPGYEYISGHAERNLLYGGDYITILMRRRN